MTRISYLLWIIWGLAIVSWLTLVVSVCWDKRRFRNSFFLMSAVGFTWIGAAATFSQISYPMFLIFSGALFCMLLAVPVILIFNGIVTLKRERKSPQNALSLLLGVMIALGELATFAAFHSVFVSDLESFHGLTTFLLSAFSLSVIYVSFIFLSFVLYTLFIQLIPRKRDFDYVIIHGCGLKNGREVTKLLAGRLDKAIEVYQKDPTPPIMIPSGGKGSDEELAEAEVMAAYLLSHGVKAEDIIPETRSTTTMENLKYSKEIIEKRGGRKYTALVTSNYHVWRAMRYTRAIGFTCTGIGAHVVFYYWINALIREFAAIFFHERKHTILIMVGWGLVMLFCYRLYL